MKRAAGHIAIGLMLTGWAAPTAAQPQQNGAVAVEPTPQVGRRAERDAGQTPEGEGGSAPIAATSARLDDSGEPSVDQVVVAALMARKAHLEALDGLAARARRRGWIPTLDISARRGQAVDLASTSNLDRDSLRLSTDDDLTLQARLRFDLPQLVFAREEVSLAREQRARRKDTRDLTAQVISLYFERRALWLVLVHDRPDDSQRRQLVLRAAEIEAQLSSFTAGRFRQMISRSLWKTDAHTSATRPPSPPK